MDFTYVQGYGQVQIAIHLKDVSWSATDTGAQSPQASQASGSEGQSPAVFALHG